MSALFFVFVAKMYESNTFLILLIPHTDICTLSSLPKMYTTAPCFVIWTEYFCCRADSPRISSRNNELDDDINIVFG